MMAIAPIALPAADTDDADGRWLAGHVGHMQIVARSLDPTLVGICRAVVPL
mgnify:CR=1 FL=1